MDDLEHPREPAPRLVFFDLDGTISRHDTLIGYVTEIRRTKANADFFELWMRACAIATAWVTAGRRKNTDEPIPRWVVLCLLHAVKHAHAHGGKYA